MVLGMLGHRGEDRATLAEAERRTQAYLRDPRSVDSEVAALAVALASRRAGAERLAALLAALPRAQTPADRNVLLGGLSDFGDPAVLRRALDATLTDAVRVQDTLRVIHRAAGTPARRAVVVQWVQEHFDALRERVPSDAVGRLSGMVGGACSEEEITRESAFWREHHVERFEGAERALRQGVEHANQCVALRARELPRLRAFLARGR
jgi:alanyl aminopeptidase